MSLIVTLTNLMRMAVCECVCVRVCAPSHNLPTSPTTPPQPPRTTTPLPPMQDQTVLSRLSPPTSHGQVRVCRLSCAEGELVRACGMVCFSGVRDAHDLSRTLRRMGGRVVACCYMRAMYREEGGERGTHACTHAHPPPSLSLSSTFRRALGSNPVVVTLDEVFILAEPRTDFKSDPSKERPAAVANKVRAGRGRRGGWFVYW